VFLIVSNGSGEELKMPIVTGSKFPADHNILDQLVDYDASRSGRTAHVLSTPVPQGVCVDLLDSFDPTPYLFAFVPIQGRLRHSIKYSYRVVS
jgi:hypothetical protein